MHCSPSTFLSDLPEGHELTSFTYFLNAVYCEASSDGLIALIACWWSFVNFKTDFIPFGFL